MSKFDQKLEVLGKICIASIAVTGAVALSSLIAIGAFALAKYLLHSVGVSI